MALERTLGGSFNGNLVVATLHRTNYVSVSQINGGKNALPQAQRR